MKPLQTLDQVMLWVATIFAGFAMTNAVFNCLNSTVLHFSTARPMSPGASLLELLIVSLLVLCLSVPWNPFSRSYVIALSVLAIPYAIFVLTLFDPGEMSTVDVASIRFVCTSLIVGFAGFFWTACRARNSSVTPYLEPSKF